MSDAAGGAAGGAASARPVTVVVDVANVMGSRPDGWWRDRAGAATRLLAALRPLVGSAADLADGEPALIARIVAVVEGRATDAAAPAGLDVVRAPADGDATIVEVAVGADGAGERVLVVTADRGLRARLPASVEATGPGWLNDLVGR
ncbi:MULTISPECIES: hypothetical protein [unclassified Agromyces]|uniref:hypothetical protein n=1 Tax=unclassified Agromyces TaxID=2639701 RepID=UPI003015633B